MELNDMMRAQSVQRWHTIDTTRPQSVAEHSFNVAMIVKVICERIGYDRSDIDRMMRGALHHDLDEIYNGDPPASAKGEVKLPQGRDTCIIKMADLMEANWFIHNYGIGPTGKKAMRGSLDRFLRAAEQLRVQQLTIYDVVMDIYVQIEKELGRR